MLQLPKYEKKNIYIYTGKGIKTIEFILYKSVFHCIIYEQFITWHVTTVKGIRNTSHRGLSDRCGLPILESLPPEACLTGVVYPPYSRYSQRPV